MSVSVSVSVSVSESVSVSASVSVSVRLVCIFHSTYKQTRQVARKIWEALRDVQATS